MKSEGAEPGAKFLRWPSGLRIGHVAEYRRWEFMQLWKSPRVRPKFTLTGLSSSLESRTKDILSGEGGNGFVYGLLRGALLEDWRALAGCRLTRDGYSRSGGSENTRELRGLLPNNIKIAWSQPSQDSRPLPWTNAQRRRDREGSWPSILTGSTSATASESGRPLQVDFTARICLVDAVLHKTIPPICPVACA